MSTPTISPMASPVRTAVHALGPPSSCLATTGPSTRWAACHTITSTENCTTTTRATGGCGTPANRLAGPRGSCRRPPRRPGLAAGRGGDQQAGRGKQRSGDEQSPAATHRDDDHTTSDQAGHAGDVAAQPQQGVALLEVGGRHDVGHDAGEGRPDHRCRGARDRSGGGQGPRRRLLAQDHQAQTHMGQGVDPLRSLQHAVARVPVGDDPAGEREHHDGDRLGREHQRQGRWVAPGRSRMPNASATGAKAIPSIERVRAENRNAKRRSRRIATSLR